MMWMLAFFGFRLVVVVLLYSYPVRGDVAPQDGRKDLGAQRDASEGGVVDKVAGVADRETETAHTASVSKSCRLNAKRRVVSQRLSFGCESLLLPLCRLRRSRWLGGTSVWFREGDKKIESSSSVARKAGDIGGGVGVVLDCVRLTLCLFFGGCICCGDISRGRLTSSQEFSPYPPHLSAPPKDALKVVIPP